MRLIELDGQPWFVGSDVLKVLYGRASGLAHVYTRLAPDEMTKVNRYHFGDGPGKPITLISESGLYKLIMRSVKPQARAFQDWVTRVVLPAIRKDGAYVLGEEKVATGEMDEDELVLKAMGIMQRKLERLAQEKAALQADNQRLLPAAEVGQAVGQRSRIGVVEFARKLEGERMYC